MPRMLEYFYTLSKPTRESSRGLIHTRGGRIISSIGPRRILYRPSGIIYQHDPILCTVYTFHCIVFAFNIIIVVVVMGGFIFRPRPLIRARVNDTAVKWPYVVGDQQKWCFYCAQICMNLALHFLVRLKFKNAKTPTLYYNILIKGTVLPLTLT